MKAIWFNVQANENELHHKRPFCVEFLTVFLRLCTAFSLSHVLSGELHAPVPLNASAVSVAHSHPREDLLDA